MSTVDTLPAPGTTLAGDAEEPRVGRLFEHLVYTTGYDVDGRPEPAFFEITDVTPDGKVFYGPGQRGMKTTATLWTWRHRFAADALSAWAGERVHR